MAAREEKRQLDIESYKESIRSRKSDDKSNSSSIKSKTRIQLEDIPKKPSSITIPKTGAGNDPEDPDKDNVSSEY